MKKIHKIVNKKKFLNYNINEVCYRKMSNLITGSHILVLVQVLFLLRSNSVRWVDSLKLYTQFYM